MKKIYTLLYYLQHLLPQSENKRNTLINYQLSTINYPLILFFVLLTIIPGCKCNCDDPTDPDCKNYDPCYGVEATSADFICYAGTRATFDDNFRRTLIETDTVSTYRALFEIKQDDCDSVKWKIGQEPDYRSGKNCYVDFYPNAVGAIDVTCIAYRQSNSNCFPNDDGRDTMTRKILIAHPDSFAWFKGKYRCAIMGDSDSFTTTIRASNFHGGIIIDSIAPPCLDTFDTRLWWSANKFYPIATCGIKTYDPYPVYELHIERDGHIWAEYYQYVSGRGVILRRLEGYKL